MHNLSNLDILRVGQVRLCIEEHLVTCQQLQTAIGDQCPVPAADHNDDRLPGNIQIPERVVHPGVVCLKDDLL